MSLTVGVMGPAIFRIHYGGASYSPHFDSVRWRENRVNYAVYRFEHQLAGILCFQNSEIEGETAQSILHRCLWQPEIAHHITDNTFINMQQKTTSKTFRSIWRAVISTFSTHGASTKSPVSKANPRALSSPSSSDIPRTMMRCSSGREHGLSNNARFARVLHQSQIK